MRIASDEAGKFIFDPTFEELEKSHLDLTIAGTIDAITMVESQGKEVDNELMVRAFEFGHKIIVELCEAQKDFLKKYSQIYTLPKVELAIAEENKEVATFVQNHLEKSDIDGLYGLGKIEFHDAIGELVEKITIQYANIFSENTADFDEAKNILEENNIKISEIADEIKNLVKADMRAKILA